MLLLVVFISKLYIVGIVDYRHYINSDLLQINTDLLSAGVLYRFI